MTVNNNRVKVHAVGYNVETSFQLNQPVESFANFEDGMYTYAVVANTGEWQVGYGEARGSTLDRGTCEENYLGTDDQIDFTGLTIQVAQVLSAKVMNDITNSIGEGTGGHTYTPSEIKALYEENDDTNAYTDADMSKLAYCEENSKDDQQASEVPFVPTVLNVANQVQWALENIETLIEDHEYDSTTVIYDSTDDNVTVADYVQSALVDHSKAIESNVPSINGLTSGGRLSAVIGADTFSIVAGTGLLADAYSDIPDTQLRNVSWDDYDNVAIVPEIGDLSLVTIRVFLDFSQGAARVIKLIGLVPNQAYRDYIYLGIVSVLEGTIVNVLAAPSVAKQTSTDVHDLMKQNIHIKGGWVIAVEDALSIWQKGGTLFYPGINWYDSNRKDPNILEFTDTSSNNYPYPRNALTFSTINQLGTIIDNNNQTTIPTDFDDNGTITPLAPGQACVHRLYCLGFETNERYFVLLYGQQVYNSALLALNGFFGEDIIEPNELDNLVPLALIGVSGGAVDFNSSNEAWIISGASQSITSFPEDSGDHEDLLGRSTPDQHPIEAVGDTTSTGQLTKHLGDKTQFWGEWVPGPLYPMNAMVTDASYLSICTAAEGSLEPPAPVLVGDPYTVSENVTSSLDDLPVAPPVYSTISAPAIGDVIQTGVNYGYKEDVYVQQILAKVPNVSADVEYRVMLIINPDDEMPVSREFFPDFTVADQWEIIETGSLYFPLGATLRLYIEAVNSVLATEFYTDDDYFVETNIGLYSSGFYTVNGVLQPDIANDIFSVDLVVQNFSMSNEWKILASSTSGSTASEGGTAEPIPWGSIIGDITAQSDLMAELATKVNNTRVLTDVPANAIFTDTVYIHPTTDGNFHCPEMGTVNAGKVLTAGPAIGDLYWGESSIKPVTDAYPPESPNEGQEWMDNSSGLSYTWYAQGTGQWIQEG